MITLALFRQMAEEQVAGLIEDENFKWEEMPVPENGEPAEGVWMVTRGGSATDSPRGYNLRTTVDFYVTFNDKTKTEMVQQEILKWVLKNRCFCELAGTIGSAKYDYRNIRIRPTTTPENAGVTVGGLIVKTASVEIIYNLAK